VGNYCSATTVITGVLNTLCVVFGVFYRDRTILLVHLLCVAAEDMAVHCSVFSGYIRVAYLYSML